MRPLRWAFNFAAAALTVVCALAAIVWLVAAPADKWQWPIIAAWQVRLRIWEGELVIVHGAYISPSISLIYPLAAISMLPLT